MVAEAITDYEKALKHLDDSDYIYQARFNLGIQYRRVGRHDESIHELSEAIKIKTDKSSAFNNLGLSFFEKGEMDGAIEHYSSAVKLCASSVHYNNRGLAFYHNDELDKALQDFDHAVKLDPNDSTIYFNRGNVNIKWLPPRFDDAHRDYDFALQLDQENPKLWHSKGLAYQTEAELISAESKNGSDAAYVMTLN